MPTYYDKGGQRKIPYKEDSTKGSSHIDPLNYKGDVLTQAWIDSRVLASLGLWMEKNGFYPKSMADVARKPLEILIEFLVEKGQAVMVEDTIEAREYLQRRFRTPLNRGGRGLKNVLHNSVLSGKREELACKMAQGQRFNDSQVPGGKKQYSSEVYRLMDIYNDLEAKETKEKTLANAKAAGMIAEDEEDDTKAEDVSSIHEGASLEELEAHVAKEDAERIAAENDPETLEFLKSQVVKDEE